MRDFGCLVLLECCLVSWIRWLLGVERCLVSWIRWLLGGKRCFVCVLCCSFAETFSSSAGVFGARIMFFTSGGL